jgi:hypothetical protein
MSTRPIAGLIAAGLTLSACQGNAGAPSGEGPTPAATATPAAPARIATAGLPVPAASPSKGIVATPDPDPCGADKLGPYLNLLPTSTATEEIATTVGHDRIRYVGPEDIVTQEFREDRLTARLGVDGRIKSFGCN